MESDVIELVRHWIVFLCRQAIISLGPWGFHFVESKSVILFCESSNTKDCTILVDQLDSDKNEHQNEAVSNHVKLMRVINSHRALYCHTTYLRNSMWPECGHKSGLWDDSIF